MKRFRLTLEGKTFEVAVENPDANPVRVTVDGETFEIPLETLDEVAPAAPEANLKSPISNLGSAAPAGHVLKAPMPGAITRVSVRPGDHVERGQELMVLEAMKMNNIIRAAAPGQIAEVRVTEKQSVQHGDILVVFGD